MKQAKPLANANADTSVVSALILNGDLGKLSPQEKVQYYNGYCDRLGLDPFTKPFDILRLNGKEILYCTRSGAQQLNKLHNVSHQITSRELIDVAGVYQVTARASITEGRCTESIGAVSIAGLKGEQYANAIMKAETKAKRRATLDLLGLGVIDEIEAESIPNAQKVDITKPIEIKDEEKTIEEMSEIDVFCRRSYAADADILMVLDMCESIEHIKNLYLFNTKAIEADTTIKSQFTKRKNEIRAIQ